MLKQSLADRGMKSSLFIILVIIVCLCKIIARIWMCFLPRSSRMVANCGWSVMRWLRMNDSARAMGAMVFVESCMLLGSIAISSIREHLYEVFLTDVGSILMLILSLNKRVVY